MAYRLTASDLPVLHHPFFLDVQPRSALGGRAARYSPVRKWPRSHAAVDGPGIVSCPGI